MADGALPGFRRVSLTVVVLLLSASTLAAQSKRPEDLAAGKLLVMSRDSGDPNFAKSVVLLIQHDEDGAAGLMVNRPTKVSLADALPKLEGSEKYTGPVYAGGPVRLGSVLALTQSRAGPHPDTHIFGMVYLISARADMERALAAGSDPNELRIYLGYCGWGPGQLENEVSRGDWYIFDATEPLVFDSEPSTLWSRMIARVETRIASLLRRYAPTAGRN